MVKMVKMELFPKRGCFQCQLFITTRRFCTFFTTFKHLPKKILKTIFRLQCFGTYDLCEAGSNFFLYHKRAMKPLRACQLHVLHTPELYPISMIVNVFEINDYAILKSSKFSSYNDKRQDRWTKLQSLPREEFVQFV